MRSPFFLLPRDPAVAGGNQSELFPLRKRGIEGDFLIFLHDPAKAGGIQSFNNVKRNTKKYWTPTYAGEKFPSLFL
jgi:hypothetical protein